MSKALGIAAIVIFAAFVVGHYLGLVWSPPEREMGDVYRIMYVHVPLMLMTMLAACFNFAGSVGYLANSDRRFDALGEASAEVCLLLGGVGIVLGSLWAKPTWGVWWDWDPRLTSLAIMLILYSGYLALRKFVDDGERRATWAAVSGIVIGVDVPVIHYSVRWWRTLHQMNSSPATVDGPMVFTLRWNISVMLALMVLFIAARYQVARNAQAREVELPELLPSNGVTP